MKGQETRRFVKLVIAIVCEGIFPSAITWYAIVSIIVVKHPIFRGQKILDQAWGFMKYFIPVRGGMKVFFENLLVIF